MTVRQSIEVERNRQRVEEDLQQEEEGEQQVTVAFEHRDMTAQQEIGSSANAKLVGSQFANICIISSIKGWKFR